MKKGLLFKIIYVIILLISSILLSITIPLLYKILADEYSLLVDSWHNHILNLKNIYVGVIIGAIISIFSLIRLDYEVQIKIIRILLILSTMLAAITYIIFRSVS